VAKKESAVVRAFLDLNKVRTELKLRAMQEKLDGKLYMDVEWALEMAEILERADRLLSATIGHSRRILEQGPSEQDDA